ncbi:unnamed protein product [Clavelina lepadiformis]|uniref:Uncharacterized protein n=1 Tax=Clavelina lepadiformis TaxID=159417 RepID=A0ABP0FZT2_CLALP
MDTLLQTNGFKPISATVHGRSADWVVCRFYPAPSSSAAWILSRMVSSERLGIPHCWLARMGFIASGAIVFLIEVPRLLNCCLYVKINLSYVAFRESSTLLVWKYMFLDIWFEAPVFWQDQAQLPHDALTTADLGTPRYGGGIGSWGMPEVVGIDNPGCAARKCTRAQPDRKWGRRIHTCHALSSRRGEELLHVSDHTLRSGRKMTGSLHSRDVNALTSDWNGNRGEAQTRDPWGRRG